MDLFFLVPKMFYSVVVHESSLRKLTDDLVSKSLNIHERLSDSYCNGEP